jgi:segregation and condensation protein A
METDTLEPVEAASAFTNATYGVKLEIFEGPLDLLLYLIRKAELDIYDIPIARITSQFLVFLDQLHRLHLEQASEFILMAATLMKIKSQMLLPREEEVVEEEDDPRAELVRRLLEYQQFKDMAEWLSDERTNNLDIFLRNSGPDDEVGEETELRPVSLFALLQAYKHVLENVPKTVVHRIVTEQVSVEDCIEYVLAELGRRTRLSFVDLVEGKNRMTLVATFISLLELLKSQSIHVQQARPFDPIWIEAIAPRDVPAKTEIEGTEL